jgi:hypothetical protein
MKISSQSVQQKVQNTTVGCVRDKARQEEIFIAKTNVIRMVFKPRRKERYKRPIGGLSAMHPIRRDRQSIKIAFKLNL